MKTIMQIIAVSGATTSPAIAGEGLESTGSSLLVILFLGFGALIVVCQLVPGLVLFCSMIKGLFSRSVKKPMPVTGNTAENAH